MKEPASYYATTNLAFGTSREDDAVIALSASCSPQVINNALIWCFILSYALDIISLRESLNS